MNHFPAERAEGKFGKLTLSPMEKSSRAPNPELQKCNLMSFNMEFCNGENS